MASIARRLSILGRQSPPAAAAFVADAMGFCSDDELKPIIDFAVELGRPESLAAAIAVCHRLGPCGAGRFKGAVDLRPAAALAGPRRNPVVLRNLIAITMERADPLLLGLILPGLETPGEIAGAAAEAVLSVIVDKLGASGRRAVTPVEAMAIDDAVTAAAECYRDHRRDEVLIAAALCTSRDDPSLRRLLADEDAAIGMSLRAIGDRLHEPLVRHNLLRWLGNDVLARSAGRWLHGLHSAQEYEDALADGHLLLAPRRRRAIRHADRPLRCLPDVSVAVALPDRGQSWVPVLAERLDLSTRARTAALADCIALPSPVARLRAVSALLSQPRARAATALAAFTLDRHPVVARLAAQGELIAAPPVKDDLVRLARVPHGRIAGRARALLARLDIHAFVAEWPTLAPEARRAAVVEQLTRDRDACIDALAGLVDVEGDSAVVAIMTVRRLGVVAALESILMSVAERAEPRRRSAALAALADGRDPRRRMIVERALDAQSHPRVRANATDVLGVIGEHADTAILLPLVNSRDNRLRGNAVRALYRLGEETASTALRAMFRDRDPLHRITGIWVARSIRAGEEVRELHRLVASDPRGEIRARARRTVAAIDFWSPRAIPVEASS